MQRQDETLASVTIEPGHGATVTYRDQCSFPELEPDTELELVCGEQRVLVSRHQVWPLEGAEWPQQHLYHLPPPPLYCEVQGYGKIQDTRLLVLGSFEIFK